MVKVQVKNRARLKSALSLVTGGSTSPDRSEIYLHAELSQ